MVWGPRVETTPLRRNGRARMGPVLPWVFVVGVAIGAVLTQSHWRSAWRDRGATGDAQILWQQSGAAVRTPVTVLRTIDGDTFEARVTALPNRTLVTRVRLRGIDAPELKAHCADELRRAEAATDALEALLRQGEVTIFNIGPDKYEGRVVTDVATKRTANVSATLLAAGHARAYDGGHRQGWC